MVLRESKDLKKVDIELTFIPLENDSTLPEVIRAKFVRNHKQEIKQIIFFASDANVSISDLQIYRYKGAFIIKFSNSEKYSNTESDPYNFHKL